MNEILQGLMPALSVFAVTVGTVFLGWLTTKLNEKFGKEIEEAKKVMESLDRDALHSAFRTAAAVVVGKGLVGQEAIDFMLKYVFKSTPEALENLSPSTQVLVEIATSKLEEQATKKMYEVAISNGVNPAILRNALVAAQTAVKR